MNYKTIWSVLRETFDAWNEHEAPRLGPALAFYTILSLAPLVILAIAIAGAHLRTFYSPESAPWPSGQHDRPPRLGGWL